MDFSLIKASNRSHPSFNDEKEKTWDGPFAFIQGADPQLGLMNDWNNVPKEQWSWTEEIRLTKLAVQRINNISPKPKFFVICGDLVHAEPDKADYKPQIADLKEALKDLDPSIRLVCVCGNHDIGNTPTPASIQSYNKNFGDDYFSFWCGGVVFLVVNSQFFKDPSAAQEQAHKHDAWLTQQLAIAKDSDARHVVVFQHIPLFLKTADEANDGYFNIEKELRLSILERLKKAGVKYIFCGHYHRNAGGFDGDLEVIVTSAIGCQLGNDKSGMRVVRVFSDIIDHQYFELEKFPEKYSIDSSIHM